LTRLLKEHAQHKDEGISASVSDPNWILNQDGKHDPQKWGKIKKFYVLNSWMFSFTGLKHLLYLGRPFWRPRDRQIAIFDKKILNFFPAVP
jgi:hypothetical protein